MFNTVDDDEETEDEDQTMPEINVGDSFKVQSTKLTEGHTQPPSRYTEASILYAMENAGRFVESKDMKDMLKEVSGIGTPATRADIIEKLVDSGSIDRVEFREVSGHRVLIKRAPGNRGPTECGTTHEATSGMSS